MMTRKEAIEHVLTLSSAVSSQFSINSEETAADEAETRAALLALGVTEAELALGANDAGVRHPTLSDVVTPESNEHIASCPQCQAVLPPETVRYAQHMDAARRAARK